MRSRLWFCNQHRLADTTREPPCCSSAVLAVAAGDRAAWLRIRFDMRNAVERQDLLELRLDTAAMLAALARHVGREGRLWATGVA